MGFYPNAGTNDYWLGCPLFDSLKVRLPGGILTIRNDMTADAGDQITTTLNGTPIESGIVTWEMLRNGGELIFR